MTTSGQSLGVVTSTIENNGNLTHSSGVDQTLGGAITGTGSLTKSSNSTLTLSGDNAYAGITTVSAGTLVVSGDQSAATGDVSVSVGATLAGNGTIGGATTISGTHAVGADPSLASSIGIQTFSSDLSYSAGAIVNWQLTDNTSIGRGTVFDGVNVIGNLEFAGSTTLNLDLNGVDFGNGFWSADQAWTIWDVTGTGPSAANFANLSLGTTLNGTGTQAGVFSLVQNGSNIDLQFTATAVPEPSSLALLGVGLAVLARRRRK